MPEIIPTIIERWSQGAAVGYDIYSRLLKDRIIFVGGWGGGVYYRCKPRHFISRGNNFCGITGCT